MAQSKWFTELQNLFIQSTCYRLIKGQQYLKKNVWNKLWWLKWRRNNMAVSEKFCLKRQLLKTKTLIDLKIYLDYGNFCWAFYHTRNLFLLRLQKPAVSQPSRVYLRQRPNYLVSYDSLQKTSSSPIPSVLFCGRYVMHKWKIYRLGGSIM